MKAYRVLYFNGDADDGRGCTEVWDPDEIYLTPDTPQGYVDERNAQAEAAYHKARQSWVDMWQKRKDDHDALFAAGLRDAPYKLPRPEHPTWEEALESERYTCPSHWSLGEIELLP